MAEQHLVGLPVAMPPAAPPPPDLGWADVGALRVGVYGLGREGAASVRACLARGTTPVLVDDDPSAPGPEGLPVLPTAAGGLEALASCDVVVKSPGISRYGDTVRQLVDAGIAVAGGLGLWLHDADLSRVVCLTGTKGKSTTTAVLAHLACGLGVPTRVAGNIGVAPFDPAGEGEEPSLWAVEVSSYQALDAPVAPPAVGVTSLHPDHLPWHAGDVSRYYADKLSLCRRPGSAVTVANGDSPLLRERAGLLADEIVWIGERDHPGATWPAALGLRGAHNRRNALIARELLAQVGVPGCDDDAALGAAARGFAGLEHRLQVVAEVDGVEFVDDSLSTNVLPTLAALEAFPEVPVALVVGGQSRGIDYGTLADGLRPRTSPVLVLAVPDNGPEILAALRTRDPGPLVTASPAADLAAAVRAGFAWAREAGGGVVLLSPAAPSFGRFADYAARGHAFTEIARGLA